MATQKTANDYREERKARLAKAAKQNNRRSHRINGPSVNTKAGKIIGIVIAALVVIGIAAGICYSFGIVDRLKTVKTVDGHSYSAVEYEYYYRSVHNYYYNMASQYESQGQGMGVAYTGYDYTQQPEAQLVPEGMADFTNEDGSQPNWRQYFEHLALESLARYHAVEDLAKENDYEVPADKMQEAYDQLEQLRTSIKENAAQNNGMVMSLGKYLRQAYGKGMTEGLFKKIIERETISQEYSEQLIKDKSGSYTDEEFEAEYEKDPSAYNVVDLMAFSFAPAQTDLPEDASEEETAAATEKASKEAKDKADKFYAEIKDVKDFTKTAEKYATDEQKEDIDFDDENATLRTHSTKDSFTQFSQDDVDWIFSSDRKANDKKLIDVSDTYFVIMVQKPAYRDDDTLPVDVRHILYQFDEEAEDKDADKAQCKADAEAALAEIKAADDVEAKFIEVCTENSDDTGSAENGGLIEKAGRGTYVKNFENWCFDPDRKPGDLDVIETEYGYHVMYFVQTYDKPMWKLTISESLANTAITEQLEELAGSDTYKIDPDSSAIKKLADKVYGRILKSFYPDAAPLTTAAAQPEDVSEETPAEVVSVEAVSDTAEEENVSVSESEEAPEEVSDAASEAASEAATVEETSEKAE